MTDLVDKRAIVLKGCLFVVLAALASGALFARDPSWTTAFLLACVLWSAARAYYFAFYVLERYVDPELRYAGILALVRAIRRRARTASRASDPDGCAARYAGDLDASSVLPKLVMHCPAIAPFLVAACTFLIPSAKSALALETKYERDVAYLLDEFEKQAGPLLREKGVDWKAVRKEFDAAAKTVDSDVAHVELCGRLLARLQDGHAAFTRVDVAMPERAPQHGVGLSFCEFEKKVLVKQAFGPAAASGIESGFELVSVDGQKALEWLDARTKAIAAERCFSSAHAARHAACHAGLLGADGTSVDLEFDRAKGGKKKVKLAFAKDGGNGVYSGPIFPVAGLRTVGERDLYGMLPSGFAYLHLREVAGDLPDELDTALAGLGNAPGLILDMRANGGGGTDHAAVFGRFLAPGTKWNQYAAAGKSHYAGPMVVIVDAGTRSAGETVAGQFKEDGRAYMIGPSPTHGMSAQKTQIEPPSKLFEVRIAIGSNKQRFNGGRGIEGIGVVPNEIVAWDAKMLQAGVDPMIRRAEELLKKGFPKGAVAYVPPKPK